MTEAWVTAPETLNTFNGDDGSFVAEHKFKSLEEPIEEKLDIKDLCARQLWDIIINQTTGKNNPIS